ncbi:hypothetical protein HYPSUDRAFT_206354 [Hypholoma sublateritium FD-334 SS-4]|uniref:Uncharacterized protein n=1 Tax=Hypholoma sublateritium (strain FD-334 SS-4) TaxID=945553 RepID=A0A0D2NE32_HYPSF|nr:hypothetical protein HYPSUDRAFT_206354 [Hypholoma sublateritium FD-334 SS-4]
MPSPSDFVHFNRDDYQKKVHTRLWNDRTGFADLEVNIRKKRSSLLGNKVHIVIAALSAIPTAGSTLSSAFRNKPLPRNWADKDSLATIAIAATTGVLGALVDLGSIGLPTHSLDPLMFPTVDAFAHGIMSHYSPEAIVTTVDYLGGKTASAIASSGHAGHNNWEKNQQCQPQFQPPFQPQYPPQNQQPPPYQQSQQKIYGLTVRAGRDAKNTPICVLNQLVLTGTSASTRRPSSSAIPPAMSTTSIFPPSQSTQYRFQFFVQPLTDVFPHIAPPAQRSNDFLRVRARRGPRPAPRPEDMHGSSLLNPTRGSFSARTLVFRVQRPPSLRSAPRSDTAPKRTNIYSIALLPKVVPTAHTSPSPFPAHSPQFEPSLSMARRPLSSYTPSHPLPSAENPKPRVGKKPSVPSPAYARIPLVGWPPHPIHARWLRIAHPPPNCMRVSSLCTPLQFIGSLSRARGRTPSARADIYGASHQRGSAARVHNIARTRAPRCLPAILLLRALALSSLRFVHPSALAPGYCIARTAAAGADRGRLYISMQRSRYCRLNLSRLSFAPAPVRIVRLSLAQHALSLSLLAATWTGLDISTKGCIYPLSMRATCAAVYCTLASDRRTLLSFTLSNDSLGPPRIRPSIQTPAQTHPAPSESDVRPIHRTLLIHCASASAPTAPHPRAPRWSARAVYDIGLH